MRAGVLAVRTRCVIAIATHRRSSLLGALLDGVVRQRDVPPDLDVEVLVIDNDAARSAAAVVGAALEALPFPLEYVCVPEPGLSVVRNYALAYARRRAQLLVMIDDDECPSPAWLVSLVAAQREHGCAAVVGPVPRRLPAYAPSWIRRGAFFAEPLYPDGAALDDGYSGNCLLDLRAPAVDGLAFDPMFNVAGGEDQLFFRALRARGGRIVFAARAVAEESVGR